MNTTYNNKTDTDTTDNHNIYTTQVGATGLIISQRLSQQRILLRILGVRKISAMLLTGHGAYASMPSRSLSGD